MVDIGPRQYLALHTLGWQAAIVTLPVLYQIVTGEISNLPQPTSQVLATWS